VVLSRRRKLRMVIKTFRAENYISIKLLKCNRKQLHSETCHVCKTKEYKKKMKSVERAQKILFL